MRNDSCASTPAPHIDTFSALRLTRRVTLVNTPPPHSRVWICTTSSDGKSSIRATSPVALL